MLFCSSSHDQLSACVVIRKALSAEAYPRIDDVVDAGFLPRLIELLKIDPDLNPPKNLQLLFQCSWAVTNLCSGEQRQ